jgi:mono/diheme cytochrome c family protein
MKKFLGAALAALALGILAFALPPSAAATGCNVRRAVVVQHQQHHAQAVVIAPAVAIATYVPVPLLAPSYGVSYDDGRLQKLQVELEALRKQNEQLLQKLIGPGVPGEKRPLTPATSPPEQPPEQTFVPPVKGAGLGVMTKSCAACHEAAVAKSKGAGITLLSAGALAPLTADLKLATVRSLLKGTMPKGGKISDEDATLVLELVSQ